MLNDEFVTVAINSGTHQQRQDQPGQFFQKIADQGHYAGRTKPTNTRQGIYITTPEGVLLRSDNTTDARQVAGLIYPALRHWKSNFADEKREPVNEFEPDANLNPTLPADGLSLSQTMRDLPRIDQANLDAWRHNFDHLWMTKAEAMSFVPDERKEGATQPVDPKLTNRFLKFHLVDQVRGSSNPWDDGDIQSSKLNSTIVEVGETLIRLDVFGTAKINQKPSGKVNPFINKQVTRDRGVDLTIVGRLVFNLESKTFDRFDLIAYGDRWGADVYNNRHRDLESAPIGFAFELADPKSDPTPPTFMLWHQYFDQQ